MNTVTDMVRAVWATSCEMAPYLLLGFLVAGVLSVWMSAAAVERHLGGRGLWPVLKASLLGVPLPLCSCGVIPVAASLRRHGAGRGATTAFLISTPQTGVDSIMATFSLLGPVYAVFRPLAAFVSGIVGGALVDVWGEGTVGLRAPDTGSPCDGGGGARGRPAWFRALHYGFVTLPRDIGRSLLIGLVVAGLIAVLIPGEFFTRNLNNDLLQMLLMMLVGIPLYVCATGSIPVAAVMVAKGISPGAALVFLMTGPATNAATISMVWSVLGRRAATVYLAAIAATALVSGWLLNLMYTSTGMANVHVAHEMLPAWVETFSALVLWGLLAVAFLPVGRRRTRAVATDQDDRMSDACTTLFLTVEGMSCSHCAAAVERALRAERGVRSAEVSLGSRTATVTGNDLDPDSLQQSVSSLGYRVLAVRRETPEAAGA